MLPAVFLRLCAHFHQDVDVLYRDLPEAIAAFVAGRTEAEARELVTYLRTDLLNREPETIEAIWHSCGSDLFFEDTAGFLQAVADEADAILNRPQTLA